MSLKRIMHERETVATKSARVRRRRRWRTLDSCNMFAAGLAAEARDNDVVGDNGLLRWIEVAIRRKWRSHVAVVKQANRLMLHNWEREKDELKSSDTSLFFFFNK